MRKNIIFLGVLVLVAVAVVAMSGSVFGTAEKAAPQFAAFTVGEMQSLTGGALYQDMRCGNETPSCPSECYAVTYRKCNVFVSGWMCEDDKSPFLPTCFNNAPGSGPCTNFPNEKGSCSDWQYK